MPPLHFSAAGYILLLNTALSRIKIVLHLLLECVVSVLLYQLVDQVLLCRLPTGSLDSRHGGSPKDNPQEIVSVGLAEWAGSAIRNSIPVEDRPRSPQTPESPGNSLPKKGLNGWEWSAGAGSGSSESRDTSPVSPTAERESLSCSPSRSSRDNWGTGWSPAR